MTLSLTRLATLAAATPLLLGDAAHGAVQKPILELVKDALDGCYGAVVTVCDPYVTADAGEGTPVPVCVISCTTYYVPTAPDEVCVGWTSHNGATTNRCLPLYTDRA